MNTLPDHFFISSCDGSLSDTRRIDWASNPLRHAYKHTFCSIENSHQLRATLRAGQWAWPGGYPMYLVVDDGACLCFDCARKEYRLLAISIREYARNGKRYSNDSWRVVACDINWEDPNLYCDHCGKSIQSAYGSD